MPISISACQAPVFVTTAIGVPTEDEYARYLEDCTRTLFASSGPYAFLYDGTYLDTLPRRQRSLQADWINAHRIQIMKQNKGSAFVFSSSLQRGLLVALHFLSPPPYPHIVRASRDDAFHWCEDRLTAAGVTLPWQRRTLAHG